MPKSDENEADRVIADIVDPPEPFDPEREDFDNGEQDDDNSWGDDDHGDS